VKNTLINRVKKRIFETVRVATLAAQTLFYAQQVRPDPKRKFPRTDYLVIPKNGRGKISKSIAVAQKNATYARTGNGPAIANNSYKGITVYR
jgi:hypothetical protein